MKYTKLLKTFLLLLTYAEDKYLYRKLYYNEN